MQPDVPVSSKRSHLISRWWFWLLLAAVGYYLTARGPLPFVKSWWNAGDVDWYDDWHRRHRMADWMVLTGNLVGLTRAEVVDKLGEPPPTKYFQEFSMVYILGAERGLISLDSEWLVLNLDTSGHVSDASIVTD